MEVKGTVKLTTKELYSFLMYNTYSTVTSFIWIILSIGAFVGFFYMLGMPNANPLYLAVLLCIGLLFTVVQPIMLYFKAKKQVKKNEAINASLQYTFSKAGIGITQGDLSAFCNWDEIVKVSSNKTLIMLYTSRMNAYIIPKTVFLKSLEELKGLIKENCDASYMKL